MTKSLIKFLRYLNQSIWNDKYILHQDEGLFYPYLCKKGISQVKDLINVDTTASIFLNWNSAKHKFNLKPNDFMRWINISDAGHSSNMEKENKRK